MKRIGFFLSGSIITFLPTSAFTLSNSLEFQQSGMDPWAAFLLLLLIIIIIAILMILYAKRTGQSVKEAGLDHAEHSEEAVLESEQALPEEPIEMEKAQIITAADEVESTPLDEAEEPVAGAIVPEVESAPAMPDDLTDIEGIGPKISSVLQAAGITTFSQLAAADVHQLKQLMQSANLRLADPTSWPQQAAHLAAGESDKFEELKSRLHGGKFI
jgi:predicted flap endonuclease-1-like 5' DNA nuclease